MALQIKNMLGGGKPEGLYAWKKCENDTDHTFIDYVVSDKESAYPDGGEKNGYWYKRVVEGAKVAHGSITVNTVNQFTIAHGLGTKPKLFVIFPVTVENYVLRSGLAYYIEETSQNIINAITGESSLIQVTPAKAYNSYSYASFTLNEHNVIIPKSYTTRTTSDDYALQWMGTFNWIAIA